MVNPAIPVLAVLIAVLFVVGECTLNWCLCAHILIFRVNPVNHLQPLFNLQCMLNCDAPSSSPIWPSSCELHSCLPLLVQLQRPLGWGYPNTCNLFCSMKLLCMHQHPLLASLQALSLATCCGTIEQCCATDSVRQQSQKTWRQPRCQTTPCPRSRAGSATRASPSKPAPAPPPMTMTWWAAATSTAGLC